MKDTRNFGIGKIHGPLCKECRSWGYVGTTSHDPEARCFICNKLVQPPKESNDSNRHAGL